MIQSLICFADRWLHSLLKEEQCTCKSSHVPGKTQGTEEIQPGLTVEHVDTSEASSTPTSLSNLRYISQETVVNRQKEHSMGSHSHSN